MNKSLFRSIAAAVLAALCALGGGCQERPAAEPELPPAVGAAVVDTAAKPEVPAAAPEVSAEVPEVTPDVPEVSADVPEVSPDVPEVTPATPEVTEALPEATADAAEELGPELPECEAVGDEFFADAAFLGNSLVDGLRRYGGLEQGSFFAATSASVVNADVTRSCVLENGEKATLVGALTEREYGKIYILLGINEIGFEPDYFAELYGALLDRIRESEPDADIYIMSLSPVTEKRSGDNEIFTMERIGLYNQALRELARERGCYYIDLCQALAGDDGFLPEADSTDGIHLTQEKYPQWAQYLRTHVKQE